jgi:hypothetical protein
MNPRTCQLCGKPLSRLRVGSDGDFCSKEHRHQFRLRAGMDRLVEVNKVASLMRRRESARQIAPASLIRNAAQGRRGFFDAKPTAIDTAVRMIEMRPAKGTHGRIGAFSDRCLQHRPKASQGAMPSIRTHSGVVRIAARSSRPLLPERAHHLTAAFPQTPAAALRSLARNGESIHRETALRPDSTVRTDPGSGPRAFKQAPRTALTGVARMRLFPTPPVVGTALRVSIPQAFRVPPVQAVHRPSTLKAASRLQPSERLRAVGAGKLDGPKSQRPLTVGIPELPVQLPSPPESARSAGFHGMGAVCVSGEIRRLSTTGSPRSHEISWRTSEARWMGARLSQSAAGFARRNGSRLHKLALTPNATHAAFQIVESPFVSHEAPLVPKVPYQNVLATAIVSPEDTAPAQPMTPPAPAPMLVRVPEIVRHEEHFDSGWDNWVGGVSDWKVDVAGVRTGSLALYLPTLEMSDYDLEFLARIDTQSVNWVVRAVGRDTYLRCTITAEEGGKLAFSRSVVKDGAADTQVTASQRAPGKRRTAITVRMSVAGPVYSVSIDGNTIESWVDDRLATGGIGFMGTADDRARLYWVRVQSPAAPDKEHTVS